jgi:diguanylate cyclase (GGDEF)-like protein/PAS domain S-box-containing protein
MERIIEPDPAPADLVARLERAEAILNVLGQREADAILDSDGLSFVRPKDVLERERQAERALRRSRQRLGLALDAAGATSFDWDINNNVVSHEVWNDLLLDPITEATSSYDAVLELVHPEDRDQFTANVRAALERPDGHYENEYRIVHPAGQIVWLSERGIVERDEGGNPAHLIGLTQDITGRKRAEQSLREKESQLRLFIEHAPVGIAMFDRDMRYLAVSRRWINDYSLGNGDLIGLSHYEVFAPMPLHWKEVHRRGMAGEIVRAEEDILVLPDGSTQWLRWEVRPWKTAEDHVGGIVIFSEDITQRKLNEAQILDLALRDSLTHLPNRRQLYERLGQTMMASKRSGRYSALIFLDLDDFKPLNDAHGHGAGDLFLVEVARRISHCLREVDFVARFGGDEFVVILGELDTDKTESIKESHIVAEKLRTILGLPYSLESKQGTETLAMEHHCTSSIGVALFLNDKDGVDEIIKRADSAMYRAKEAGGNTICYFD